ncbi:chemotaxis protein CheW [candidate division WOR-3 bacterium]|nr:chemotaxis protein CheW [candidate division WOR-3 bacterium]
MAKKKKISFRNILKEKKDKEKKETHLKKIIPEKPEKRKKEPEIKITRKEEKVSKKIEKLTPVSFKEMMIVREGKEYYGIPLDYIEEIRNEASITEAPHLPEFVTGVTEVRDVIVPVIDFANLLGLREKQKRTTPIIMIEVSDQIIGLQFDEVVEIVDIKKEEILPLPDMFPSKVLIGAYNYNSRVTGILRVERLLKGKHLQSFKETGYENSK